MVASAISESVIIFGTTGNVVMVVNGEMPQNASLRTMQEDPL